MPKTRFSVCDRAAPSRPTGSSRLYGCWSTSPFLFSGLLLAVGATMELGRSMMSAGAGAARATGSSTTDRKICSTNSGAREALTGRDTLYRPFRR